MSLAARSRTIAAPQQTLWELIDDPHHQPRWWPGVDRVEGVAEDRFTQVLRTKRGRPVRADFRVVSSEPPWMTVWEQQLAGTPFARVLRESVIQISLEPAAGASDRTEVTIAHRQIGRGYSRTGGLILRRAAARRLDDALDGLAGLV